MKIKSLLVAGLSVLALNAMAQDIPGNGKISLDIDAIKAIGVGETSGFINAVVNYDENMGNWKNVEFTIDFPEDRLTHAACAAHNDTKVYDEVLEEDVQVLGWTAYTLEGLGMPNSAKYIGVNLTATPIENKQGMNLCRIKFLMNAELKEGDALRIWNFKVIDEGDNAWVNAEYTIDLQVPHQDVAVDNIAAGKAVAGVKYYNVAGQAADKAFDGVNVVVTTYADGTQSVAKVVK